MMDGIGGTWDLRVSALRGGTANEIIEFLADFQRAYAASYAFFWDEFGFVERKIFLEQAYFRNPRSQRGLGYRNALIATSYYDLLFDMSDTRRELATEQIAPEYVLEVSRVSIQSPGFWEFLGGLNPLQQLREYLNDRHKRRQDVEYREQSEKQRLQLEAELLEQQVRKGHLDALRSEFELMRDLKVDEEMLRQIAWHRLGPPLAALGRHQDRRLIGGPASDQDDG